MTEDTKPNYVKLKQVSEETVKKMQEHSDALIESMRSLVAARGEIPIEEYEGLVQHTIFGNAIIRLLISISETVGPLDFNALRSAAWQALAYVNHIAEPVGNGNPESGTILPN